MNIIKETKNDLLKRREIQVVVESKGNPGLAQAAKMVSEKFKVDENLVAVKELKSKFGRDTFLIKANIYESNENKSLIEPKIKSKKDKK